MNKQHFILNQEEFINFICSKSSILKTAKQSTRCYSYIMSVMNEEGLVCEFKNDFLTIMSYYNQGIEKKYIYIVSLPQFYVGKSCIKNIINSFFELPF